MARCATSRCASLRSKTCSSGSRTERRIMEFSQVATIAGKEFWDRIRNRCFFFQAEDGIRDFHVTGVQTCALPIGVLLRGVAAGRVPWANMYEFSIVFTLVAVGTFLLIQRWRDLRYLGAFVITPTLLALGLAVSVFYIKADGVRPALDHYWLVIHVSVATTAIGIFAVAAAVSLVQLVKDRGERTATARAARPVPAAAAGSSLPAAGSSLPAGEDAADAGRGFWGRLADALPGSVELERLAYRLNAVGFLLWTFTLIAGAIWAEHAWGRPWDWDPKEVGTLVVWIA